MILETKQMSKLAKQGSKIYQKKYKKNFEKTNKGKIVAIEVESGDMFLGNSTIDAGLKAKAKYPHKVFYFKRVGYPAVHSLKGFVPTF